MSQAQKHKEMNSILKDMILQKEREKQSEKRLSQQEYTNTQQEMYYPQGLELF